MEKAQKPSEYISQNPLWKYIPPQHQSHLVNPQCAQFCRASPKKKKQFKSGCILVEATSNGLLKLVSFMDNKVYSIKLWKCDLLTGYPALAACHASALQPETLKPQQAISFVSVKQTWHIVFADTNACTFWTESIIKLLNNTKAFSGQALK